MPVGVPVIGRRFADQPVVAAPRDEKIDRAANVFLILSLGGRRAFARSAPSRPAPSSPSDTRHFSPSSAPLAIASRRPNPILAKRSASRARHFSAARHGDTAKTNNSAADKLRPPTTDHRPLLPMSMSRLSYSLTLSSGSSSASGGPTMFRPSSLKNSPTARFRGSQSASGL